jgi:hypothetical protein
MSAQSSPRAPVALAAATFALACAFAAAQWAGLVESPPAGRVAAVVAIATACGVALAASARLDAERRFFAPLARVATVAVAALAATVAIGVPPALLAPSGWTELADGLARGFDGVPGARWPYAGDVWVRVTILLAIPLMSVPAAAFALWPPAPGPGGPEAAAVRRGGALLLLLTLFGLAAAQSPPRDGILRGVALLVVVAVWLFLPGLWRARRAAALAGLGAALAAGLAAVPLAAAVAPARPLVESRSAERGRALAERQPPRPQRSRERRRRERRSASGARRTSDEGSQTRSSVERRSDRRESRRRAARTPGAGGGGGERSGQGGRGASNGERDPGPPVALLLLLVLAALVAARLLPRRLRRRSGTGSPADAVAELRRALERLGWSVPAPTTLAELEPRLADAAGAPAAHYVRRLRDWRFSADAAPGPSRLERRALRRSLAGDGPLSRLRGLWALPPAPLVGAARPQAERSGFSVD